MFLILEKKFFRGKNSRNINSPMRFYPLIIIVFYFSFFVFSISAKTNVEVDVITIEGKVKKTSQDLMNLEGLEIVLLKYILNKDGEVIPVGPQYKVQTKKDGDFKFKNIIPDLQAGFQLGTRLEGNLYSSEFFFMKKEQTLIKKNISIPEISYDVGKLEISKLSIVIEAGLGNIIITEILEISNNSTSRIDTSNTPIEYRFPLEAKNFRMVSKISKNFLEHNPKSISLKIGHTFQPGNSQIVYQYILPARFGSLEINREFDHSFDIVGIFTPINLLEIRSDMIAFNGKQKFDQTTFLSWKIKVTDSNRLKIKIYNVPQTYFQYFSLTILLLILFSCTLLLFFNKKLQNINNLL